MFPGKPWYHPTAQLHRGFLRKAVGDFVTPIVLEMLFDYYVLLNLQVHTLGMPLQVCLGLSIFHRYMGMYGLVRPDRSVGQDAVFVLCWIFKPICKFEPGWLLLIEIVIYT